MISRSLVLRLAQPERVKGTAGSGWAEEPAPVSKICGKSRVACSAIAVRATCYRGYCDQDLGAAIKDISRREFLSAYVGSVRRRPAASESLVVVVIHPFKVSFVEKI